MLKAIGKKLIHGHKIFKKLLVWTLLAPLAGSCGYYNPNMLPQEEQGPPVSLYVPIWPNPTSEAGLANDIHNALNDWFIQSKRIKLTKNKEDADYLLTGSIVSVNFPGRSYTVTDQATALKAVLTVNFKVQEKETDYVVIARNGLVLQETFSIGATLAETDDNQRKAIETITDDLAEQVYIRTLRALMKHQRRTNAGKQSAEN